MRSPASMRDAIIRIAATGGSLLSALRHRLQQASVARQLAALDDRMLADIGLERWQIGDVARQAAHGRVSHKPATSGAAPVVAELGERAWRLILEPLLRAYRREVAYRELSSLDDRLLKDIGLTRGDIPSVVRSAATATPPEDPSAADHDLIRSLRLWNRSRSAAKALNALDDHMLNDIGLVRGDVDWVAEELAVRSLKEAVNHNRRPAAA